mmetsp:Transcript_141612/g.394776  ORF Transcript_141612/g.394776 Transcript_141612/m.394776 type:complete len:228 (-) Transcript_141612:790-1473(-)
MMLPTNPFLWLSSGKRVWAVCLAAASAAASRDSRAARGSSTLASTSRRWHSKRLKSLSAAAASLLRKFAWCQLRSHAAQRKLEAKLYESAPIGFAAPRTAPNQASRKASERRVSLNSGEICASISATEVARFLCKAYAFCRKNKNNNTCLGSQETPCKHSTNGSSEKAELEATLGGKAPCFGDGVDSASSPIASLRCSNRSWSQRARFTARQRPLRALRAASLSSTS